MKNVMKHTKLSLSIRKMAIGHACSVCGGFTVFSTSQNAVIAQWATTDWSNWIISIPPNIMFDMNANTCISIIYYRFGSPENEIICAWHVSRFDALRMPWTLCTRYFSHSKNRWLLSMHCWTAPPSAKYPELMKPKKNE